MIMPASTQLLDEARPALPSPHATTTTQLRTGAIQKRLRERRRASCTACRRLLWATRQAIMRMGMGIMRFLSSGPRMSHGDVTAGLATNGAASCGATKPAATGDSVQGSINVIEQYAHRPPQRCGPGRFGLLI
eukprot:TRINITY_DN12561_c0_g1_i2.p3 TRINITY_DN12561_c0_g1~~TRINITY_DN12561_c0_g1_i2.p3  ORF type:complete len:133 (-),score=15.82 TRINITY_DN12561_c0_g1_i2:122-520(-)